MLESVLMRICFYINLMMEGYNGKQPITPASVISRDVERFQRASEDRNCKFVHYAAYQVKIFSLLSPHLEESARR